MIMFLVDGGQRAVIFDRISGIKQSVMGEGMHFIIPWLQRAIIFDVKTRPRTISTTTGSKGILSGLEYIFNACFLRYANHFSFVKSPSSSGNRKTSYNLLKVRKRL